MKATRILLISGLVFLAAIFVVGIYIVPKLQAGNAATARQSDAARVSLSDVFVDVTYATPQFVKRVKLEPYVAQYQNRAQPFLIGINTHVGTIADLDLRGKVLLEDSHGERFPSLGTPVVLSEHHNMYLLVFPLVDNNGKAIFTADRKHFRLIVKDVGKTAERAFEWKLPVVEPEPVRTVASTLMLVLGVVGALMVILSPCAIELTTYYTGIIAGVVSSAALAEKKSTEARITPHASTSSNAECLSPSPLNGERAGVRGGLANEPDLADAARVAANHPSPSIPAHEPEGRASLSQRAGRRTEEPETVVGMARRRAEDRRALPLHRGSGVQSANQDSGKSLPLEARGKSRRAPIPREVRGRILRNLAAFVFGFTVLYMASGATVALMGQQLMGLQSQFAKTGKLGEPICGTEEKTVAAAPAITHTDKAAHANHGPGFGGWTQYANWLGSAFLIFFALKSVGVLSRGGRCFVWLAQLGRKFRMAIAAVVGLVSEKRANIIRSPAMSIRQPGNITPLNSFCAGLGLSVSCLTCMGGAILYPLLIFVGTSTWYWGALILGTYSLALAAPMAAIAVAVGNYAWQFVHRPVLIRSLQLTSATVMILVAVLIAFDRTRVINSVVFTLLTALGGNTGPSLATL